VVDDDTEELLVRSFIRNDGVAGQPNVLKMALREAQQTASPRLRSTLATELRRLPPKRSDTATMKYPDPHSMADLLDPEPFPNPPPNPSVNPSVNPSTERSETHGRRSRGGEGEGESSRNVSGSVSSHAQKRANRIPDGFAPSADMLAWATQRVPTVVLAVETEKFINYWQAKSGRDAAKLDWAATWRNWMLNAYERQPRQLKSVDDDPAVTGQRRVQL